MRDTHLATTGPRRGWRTNGPLWLTISSILFAVMAVAVRLAAEHNVPGSETTLIRFLFGLATITALHTTGVAPVRPRRVPLLAARGISGGIAIVLYFLSLAAAKGPGGTPLTNSVLLGNSYFVFVPIFGTLLIRERLRLGTGLSILVALIGLHLVVQPDFRQVRVGDVYGLAGGIVSGLAIVIIRELRKDVDAIAVFFSLCVFGSLVALAVLPFQGVIWPSALGWLVLAIMGITSTAGQITMTYALKYTGAAEAGIIQMSTVIYSSLVGILWLGDPFGARITVGAILVLASAAYISFMQNE